MSQGSIGVLVTATLKVADVLEKQHLDHLSKLLYTVDEDEPRVEDIKHHLSGAHQIHKDLVLKMGEIKSLLASANRMAKQQS